MPVVWADHNPKTLFEAVDIIAGNLDSEEIKYIHDNGATSVHHWFGMAMRNNWGLWQGSDLRKHFIKRYGIKHADDMSALILDAVEAQVKGTPWNEGDAEIHADRYKQHWIDTGCDASGQTISVNS